MRRRMIELGIEDGYSNNPDEVAVPAAPLTEAGGRREHRGWPQVCGIAGAQDRVGNEGFAAHAAFGRMDARGGERLRTREVMRSIPPAGPQGITPRFDSQKSFSILDEVCQ